MSQELDVDKLDSRVCGEDSEDFQSDSQDIVSNEDILNTKEHNIIHSSSQQQQPTSNVSKELKQQTPPSTHNNNTHFKKQTKPFIPNLTIYNTTTNSSSKANKTVFTKLSEDMYNDFIYGNNKHKNKQYDFDTLINEQFIQSYAEKFKERNNNNKVRNFLARNNKPKCVNNNGNTSSTDIKDKKTKEERIKDIQSFLQRQENYKVKKRQRLFDLKEKVYNEVGNNYTAVPQINENSNMIITQLRHNKPNEYNKNVFVKLFEEKCNKTQKETLIGKMKGNGVTKGKEGRNVKHNNNKKLTNSEIKEMVDNLYKPKSRVKSNGDNNVYIAVNTTPNKDLINQPSNNILIQRFVSSYDNEINKMSNTHIDNNHDIKYTEFKLLLYKLGFICGSTENDNDNNKENMLVKEAWCILLNKHSNKQQSSDDTNNVVNEEQNEITKEKSIQSFDLILFLLCILNLYKGGTSPLITKNFPFINLSPTSSHIITPKQSKQIQHQFRDFFKNSMNHLFKQKALSKSTRLYEHNNINNDNVNKQKYLDNIHVTSYSNIKNRPIKTYDIILKKREKSNELLRAEKQAKELKECTFYPNNCKPNLLSSNVSTEVTNRLYSQRPQRHLKQSDPSKKSENEIYSFTPMISKIDNKMFAVNPIKDDKSVCEKIEQYEKVRMDKKLNEYLLKQGTHVISNYEIINNLNNQTEPPISFRFDNEYRGYKNTFDKFNKRKGGNSNNNKQEREIKYVFEFNVENQIKSLKIYKGDNIAKSVSKFCIENNLEVESKERILNAIKEKIAKH